MLDGPPTPYYPSPHLINQFCTFHPGVVKCLKDPEGRGRAQVEVPGLLGEGTKNWTCWVEMGGNPIGSAKEKGDEGEWWPLQVGQCVLIGFVAGDPNALWMVPGPACSDGAEQQLPKEPKSYNDGRKMTRCRIRKSEAGHSLIMDDNGKSELLALLNWTGSGLAWHGPGKVEDDQESEDEESKPRKGKRRETKNVFAGTAPKPSELIEGGKEYAAFVDLMAQGMLSIADDKKGGRLGLCVKLKDGSMGPSLVLDGVNDRVYIQTSKNTQIQLYDDADIFVTRQLIWQAPFYKVKSFFESVMGKFKERFKKYDE